jgi:protein-tyrosine phosphatase
MAEFVFKDIVEKAGIGDKFYVGSAATSYEEIGNPVHYGTAKILDRLDISYSEKRAVHLEKSDYDKYDYLICMDNANVRNTLRIVGSDTENKVHKLLEFANSFEDVADPWYTGDFERTYKDVLCGCKGLLRSILGVKNDNGNR